jgi:hypothetical protein
LDEDGRKELLLSIIPRVGFRRATKDVVELFAHAYEEIEEVNTKLDEKSNSELRDWALEPNQRHSDFDPHAGIFSLFNRLNWLKTNLSRLAHVGVFVTAVLSINWLHTLAKAGLSTIEAVESTIPLSIIAFGCIYFWFLKADTFAHQTLSEELGAGRAKVMTRQREKIVGYGVWNRSLCGQAGLFLASVFFLFRSLPHLPILGRWFDQPCEYVKTLIKHNTKPLYHSNGWTGAVKHLFSQIR